VDEGEWLASTHFQRLYSQVKSVQATALTKGGRRRLRLLACACCRALLWDLPVAEKYRRAVEAAEAFADGLIGRDALDAAAGARDSRFCSPDETGGPAVTHASAAMLSAAAPRAASAAYNAGLLALSALGQAALGPKDRAEYRRRLCDLLRDIFGNPFRPLPPRPFPGHVQALARDCYDAFPAVSDRFLILADALADLGEEQAAEHCRQGGHGKGCHVLDWVLGRR
jgi:hypothetical protein